MKKAQKGISMDPYNKKNKKKQRNKDGSHKKGLKPKEESWSPSKGDMRKVKRIKKLLEKGKYQGGGNTPGGNVIPHAVASGLSKKEKKQYKKDEKRRIKSPVDPEGNPYQTLKVKDLVKQSVKDTKKRKKVTRKAARKNKTNVGHMIMTTDGAKSMKTGGRVIKGSSLRTPRKR